MRQLSICEKSNIVTGRFSAATGAGSSSSADCSDVGHQCNGAVLGGSGAHFSGKCQLILAFLSFQPSIYYFLLWIWGEVHFENQARKVECYGLVVKVTPMLPYNFAPPPPSGENSVVCRSGSSPCGNGAGARVEPEFPLATPIWLLVFTRALLGGRNGPLSVS